MINQVIINKDVLLDYKIIDVRTPAEWEDGIIEGSTLIHLYDNNGILNDNFMNEIENLSINQELAFVCKSGHRSLVAAQMVQDQLGLSSTNLDGGITKLISEGYKLVKPC